MYGTEMAIETSARYKRIDEKAHLIDTNNLTPAELVKLVEKMIGVLTY